MPGLTERMKPVPDHGEESYRGSGRLEGKKAIVTGGDSGIGRAVAIAFAREGADVLISYLAEEEEDAQAVRKLVEEAGRACILFPGDISSADHCRALVARAAEEFGRIDILVNNAAHQDTFSAIEEIDEKEWDYTFAVNIHAVFYLTKAAVAHMKPGRRSEPGIARLCVDQGRDPELHGRARPDAGRARDPGQLRRSGTHMDSAHPRDDAEREGAELRRAGADEAAGAAARARARLRDACERRGQLYLRLDDRRDRRQADHLIIAEIVRG
jgi:hypothetical protein